MPDGSILRDKARQAVEQRKLPNRQPDWMWRGPGIGAPCVMCDVPVETDEMEFQAQFAREGGAPYFDVYHLQVRCYSAWELVRAKVDGHPPS